MLGTILCVLNVLLYVIFMATLGGRHLISTFSEEEPERISDLIEVLQLICVRGVCFKFRPTNSGSYREQRCFNRESPGMGPREVGRGA